MIDFNFKDECYSCSACGNICPRRAIKFDERLLPIIDKALCVNCGLCDKVCIKQREKVFKTNLGCETMGLVCKNSNALERFISSSGGIFILLAKAVVLKGGYVCGCVYDDDFMPKHVVTNDISELYNMMGSKYVKSDMSSCINEMKELLECGHIVLFTGVPCQSAAVRNCLEKYSNLYIMNVVCHGSIEREFWKDYLSIVRKQGEIENISMRYKNKGWSNYGLKVRFKDGNENITYRNEDGYFLKCFTSGLFERERCLTCKYKGTSIVGDIICGDGWGMDNIFPDFCDDLGVSSIIVLSTKGSEMIDSIKSDLAFLQIDVCKIIDRNKRIIAPASDSFFRKNFQKNILENPDKINKICEKYSEETIISKIVNKLYTISSKIKKFL